MLRPSHSDADADRYQLFCHSRVEPSRIYPLVALVGIPRVALRRGGYYDVVARLSAFMRHQRSGVKLCSDTRPFGLVLAPSAKGICHNRNRPPRLKRTCPGQPSPLKPSSLAFLVRACGFSLCGAACGMTRCRIRTGYGLTRSLVCVSALHDLIHRSIRGWHEGTGDFGCLRVLGSMPSGFALGVVFRLP